MVVNTMLASQRMARIVRTAFASGGLLLLGLSIYVHILASYYGDKQWHMLYAQMWLSGKRLYTDIFPVSPPLLYWMYSVPALLSATPHFPGPFTMLIIVGLLVIAVSIYLSTRLIALNPAFASGRMQVQFAALLCFVLIFRTSSMFFLDREHLFFVLVLPYIIRFMPSLARAPIPWWISIFTGILAGLGLCIKPQCMVVWAGIQLLTILSQKSPRILFCIENCIIYAMYLGYVLLIWQLYPDYLNIIVPMALVAYSASRDTTPVLDYCTNALSVLVVTFLMFRLRHTSPYRRDIMYIAALCPFFLFYALSNNNWAYTYCPLDCFVLILTGFVLWEFLYLKKENAAEQKPTWQFTGGVIACYVVFAFKVAVSLNYFHLVLNDQCHGNIECLGDDVLANELQGDAHPLSFGAITIDFTRWTRLSYYTGAQWLTRFPQLWMLPKFFISDANFSRRHEWILDYIAESYADDINRNKPDVMFVDDTDVFYSALVHVDLVAFLSADTHFREAWGHYRFVHNVNLCGGGPHKEKCSYDVWRRTE